jgi:hypothetical protein
MNFEKPQATDVDYAKDQEFDVLQLSENERDINKILSAIVQTRGIMQQWGRNGEEQNVLLSYSQLLQGNPSPENIGKTVKYLKSLFTEKQDYN